VAVQHQTLVQVNESRALANVVFWTALSVSFFAAVGEVRSVSALRYFAALAVHTLATLVLVPQIAGAGDMDIPVYATLTLAACLFNPFPVNAALSIALNASLLVLRGIVLSRQPVSPAVLFRVETEYGVVAAVVTIFATLTVLYRSRFIDQEGEIRRLDGLVDRLTKANLGYQEYAKNVGESSVEGERKRITRDIHDIVGYTLTNNVIMMETVIDMMHTNPLGVARLVNTARENAQEGLARVRQALRDLREREVQYPRGLAALERLIQVFKMATGVDVELGFTEVPWRFGEELEDVLYHVVQEALVNSFRHGRATRVRVFLSRHGGELVLKIADNGVGAFSAQEGIGLAGMRERVERLGGRVAALTVQGGFDVTVSVPEGA
jgi:signal transduction histidine kinase